MNKAKDFRSRADNINRSDIGTMTLCNRCDLPIKGDSHYPHDVDRCTYSETGQCFCSTELCSECCPCDNIVGVECVA